MIGFVPEYYGWLGNQMFQYACVKALSLRVGDACSFPEKDPNLHEIFNLNSNKEFIRSADSSTFLYVEPSFNYRELPVNIPKNLILKGYFQSEKYFKDFENEIREEFTFRHQATRSIGKNTCSIHVRRGDYLKLQKNHPVCSMSYYHSAMSLVDADNYLIFSDDPEWCRLNFTQDNVEVISDQSPSEDMQLMSLCDNHIIANSSFSWWGAWLGKNINKKIIYPSKWFGIDYDAHDTSDLTPDSWISI